MTTATEQAVLRSQNAHRLFQPRHPYGNTYYPAITDVYQCSICGNIFLKGSLVLRVAKRVKKMRKLTPHSTLPFFPGEDDPRQEIARRRKHAEWHRKKGHCVLTEQGYVLTPTGKSMARCLIEEPGVHRTTAADYGFTTES